jgi:glycogen operon protein
MILGGDSDDERRLAVLINGDRRACIFTLPPREGFFWEPAIETAEAADIERPVSGRSVIFMIERAAAQAGTGEKRNGGR